MDEKQEFIEKSRQHAAENGFHLNPNEKIVAGIVNGIFLNEQKHGEKYCPCRRVSGDKEEDSKKICPCVWHKDEIAKDGHCLCNLFVK
ncbi:MAG TPA: ferredoxin-thioredoxin reductase catalytic domain-containing protein [Candidatus Staskawiczbacteria bacterium]|nr:ferredoxin-thioredoxin reductase catalytic domain-containing protein [Candidatus Staskawiczbacteria bacterium]